MKEISIISKVVSRGKAEALPSASASMPNWAELAKYVTIDGDETINGVKDFANGLMIGGLPLVKMDDDVVYLDAHLVVRGGITMFGTGEDVDVPTIMDALSVDGVNLQVINGVLTFVGEATGGVADSVRWENVIGRPTLLSSFTDDVVAGKYLPLSGGTVKNGAERAPLMIDTTDTVGAYLTFKANGTAKTYVGYDSALGTLMQDVATSTILRIRDKEAYVGSSSSGYKTILNSTNYSDYALPLSGGTVELLFVGGKSIGTGHLATVSSKARISLISFTDGHNYIESGNSDFSANTPLRITGKNAELGSDLYLFFNNIYCRGNNYINIDSGNYSSYALPYTGGRLSNSATGLFINRTTANTYPHITFESQGKAVGDIGVSFDGTKPVWYNYKTKTWSDIITSDNAANYNVGSATKLQTARTIWGQSFNGTGNVDGDLTMGNTISPTKIKSFVSENTAYTTIGGEEMPLIINNSTGGISLWKGDNNRQLSFGRQGSIEFRATTTGGWASSFGIKTNGGQSLGNVCGAYGNAGVMTYTYYGGSYDKPNMVILPNGNVGIGTTSPSFKLDVKGGVSAQSYGGYNGNTNISSSYRWGIYQWNNELQITRRDSSNTYKGTMAGFDLASGNVVFEAGITMYSDQRKKTILNHVELSLKQIADAPLIEHYYNSDESKTTHVGSIAQYWASLNHWFCKEDNEGFYTMEIQNAALASAISIARELVKYESKTDKKIRLLKKRIGELEDEIEKLKTA